MYNDAGATYEDISKEKRRTDKFSESPGIERSSQEGAGGRVRDRGPPNGLPESNLFLIPRQLITAISTFKLALKGLVRISAQKTNTARLILPLCSDRFGLSTCVYLQSARTDWQRFKSYFRLFRSGINTSFWKAASPARGLVASASERLAPANVPRSRAALRDFYLRY